MVVSEGERRIAEGNLPRPYEDVRQWLELVESIGELKRVHGADWNLEIGPTSAATSFPDCGIKRGAEEQNPRKVARNNL